MKAIRLSVFQMLNCMRRDMMLFAACLAPILAGIFFKFAIPVFETALTNWFDTPAIISPYYKLIDVFFAMLSPTMFCFVSAMVALEENDEKTAKYLFITPLGKRGYLIARFGIPSAAAPFFVKSNMQYILSPLPSLWIGKAILENELLYMLPAILLSVVWIEFLFKRYAGKI